MSRSQVQNIISATAPKNKSAQAFEDDGPAGASKLSPASGNSLPKLSVTSPRQNFRIRESCGLVLEQSNWKKNKQPSTVRL